LETKPEAEIRESILAYLGSETLVWVHEPVLVVDQLNRLFADATRLYESGNRLINRAAPAQLFVSGQQFNQELAGHPVVSVGSGDGPAGAQKLVLSAQPQASFNKNFNLLAEDLKVNQSRNIQNILLVSGQIQADRLWAIFEDIGQHQLQLKTIVGALHEGFTDTREGLAVYTDHQLFERYQRFKIKTGADKRQAITLKELNALRFGDFVTHIDHGVGQFGGLQTIENNGKKQEAIKLMYKDGDILYVSIHALHKISRFGAKEGSSPALNKLGSPAWSKLKQKTKKRVKEIAFDLIQLYARRKAAKGHAFAPDNYLQHELEASFLYEDTPDQVKATQEVKRDMEDPRPMDRLICGDVGFGKTEIAMRAAFKAAVDGKQVAVLVPTTVLAYQHYKSFRERFKDFPITVDYINRFKSGKQEKETLERLAAGKTDIIIGTHKLVSKGVQFKDLGLLIVDEEQKFGVGVKDKLKTLRVNIDTLTLTATPIPRTLQFSLMAARDLSIMTTPPANRQPVETRVTGFSEEALRDALVAEMKRGGQAFVINNRIENLREVAGMIQRLLPDAKLAVAHGQMDGEKLEQIIMEFMEGETDILISTSIVENGLDVPNANTMVVFNAHQFGLAELHQLRGRVGRSNRQAHCMLVSPPLSSLTEEARRRLHAIEQFSDLGAGFQIAMRDLEIRGAGDLLGGEQSGFISEMGFDAYQKILAEAVQELKQESFADLYPQEPKPTGAWVEECQLDTDLALLLPHSYVNQTEERLQLYQTLDNLTSEEELTQFGNALVDRFGPLPQEALELLDSMRLRWLAAQLGFAKLILKQSKLVLHFVGDQNSPYYQSPTFHGILLFIKDFHQKARMKQTQERLTLAVDQVGSIAETKALLLKMEESAARL
jgi:transcription-repair coupling factor (superfamily II helicase)